MNNNVMVNDLVNALIQRVHLLRCVKVGELDDDGIQGLQTALYQVADELVELRSAIQPA